MTSGNKKNTSHTGARKPFFIMTFLIRIWTTISNLFSNLFSKNDQAQSKEKAPLSMEKERLERITSAIPIGTFANMATPSPITITFIFKDDTQHSIELPEGTQELTQEALEEYRNLEIKSIIIPDGITTIGKNAFKEFKFLETIQMPQCLHTIADGAFQFCSSLQDLNLSHLSSLTTIGKIAFLNCIGLTSVTLPPNLTTVEYGAYYGCKELTSVTFPPTIQVIGEYAFRECDKLANLSLPPFLETIDTVAFSHCNNLTSVTLPPSITKIGLFAFANCKNLTSFTLPSNATYIDTQRKCQFHPRPFEEVGNKPYYILAAQTPDEGTKEKLPQHYKITTIDAFIPSIKDATLEKKDAALSLVDLDRTFAQEPPILHLRKKGLEQLPQSPHATILNVFIDFFAAQGNLATFIEVFYQTFPSDSLAKLKNTFSLTDKHYALLTRALIDKFTENFGRREQSDSAIYVTLEHLTLKDLNNLYRTSKDPLNSIEQKAISPQLKSSK